LTCRFFQVTPNSTTGYFPPCHEAVPVVLALILAIVRDFRNRANTVHLSCAAFSDCAG
jgi:hypothetical protein